MYYIYQTICLSLYRAQPPLSNCPPPPLSQALHYMLLVSEVEETEIFKICLEYWNHLAAELYRESPFSTSTSPLLSGNQHFDVPPRRQLYLPVLSKVPHTDNYTLFESLM